MAEDARLSGGEVPGLYTVSSDGALFAWVYEHGKEDQGRRKKRRVEPPKPLPNGNHASGGNVQEGSEAGPGPESEADARAAAFSGLPQNLKA